MQIETIFNVTQCLLTHKNKKKEPGNWRWKRLRNKLGNNWLSNQRDFTWWHSADTQIVSSLEHDNYVCNFFLLSNLTSIIISLYIIFIDKVLFHLSLWILFLKGNKLTPRTQSIWLWQVTKKNFWQLTSFVYLYFYNSGSKA